MIYGRDNKDRCKLNGTVTRTWRGEGREILKSNFWEDDEGKGNE
jgi:hypothetical protein